MPPNGRYLLEPEAVDLLAACGIPYPGHALARTAIEAAQIAKNLGWPVVLKVVSPDVPHKSDVGGVLLGLDSARQVRDGFGTLAERMGSAVPGATLEGVLVCKQAPPSPEVIVGALNAWCEITHQVSKSAKASLGRPSCSFSQTQKL
jgi:acyl-CoA synthetase (NDP forming)